MTTFMVTASVSDGSKFRRIPSQCSMIVFEGPKMFFEYDGFNEEIPATTTYQQFGNQLLLKQFGRTSHILIFGTNESIEHFIVTSGMKPDNQQFDGDVNLEDFIRILQEEQFPAFVDKVEKVLLALLK